MKIFFFDYGELQWLDPEDYFSGPWKYHCSTDNNEVERPYDIVIHPETDEWRFTKIV